MYGKFKNWAQFQPQNFDFPIMTPLANNWMSLILGDVSVEKQFKASLFFAIASREMTHFTFKGKSIKGVKIVNDVRQKILCDCMSQHFPSTQAEENDKCNMGKRALKPFLTITATQ